MNYSTLVRNQNRDALPARRLWAIGALAAAHATGAAHAEAAPAPTLTVELGAAWQARNDARIENEPPNTLRMNGFYCPSSNKKHNRGLAVSCIKQVLTHYRN